MVLLDPKTINDAKFYFKLENNNGYNDMVILIEYKKYIQLHNRRFLFVARNKFGSRYSILFFKKAFKLLSIYEKMALSYYFFEQDMELCFEDFQLESRFDIFKKLNVSLEQYHHNVKICYKKIIEKIEKMKMFGQLNEYEFEKFYQHHHEPPSEPMLSIYCCSCNVTKLYEDLSIIETTREMTNVIRNQNNIVAEKHAIIQKYQKIMNDMTLDNSRYLTTTKEVFSGFKKNRKKCSLYIDNFLEEVTDLLVYWVNDLKIENEVILSDIFNYSRFKNTMDSIESSTNELIKDKEFIQNYNQSIIDHFKRKDK